MQEELHPDIESLAPMQENPASPSALAPAAKAVGNVIAPNLTSLAAGGVAPPITPLPEQGKVPSADDPRINQAIGEFGELGATLLPMLTPGSALSLGTHVVSKLTNPVLVIAAGASALVSATPAEAAKLTGKQKQELEIKRQQLQMEGQEASRRSQETMQQELELRRQGMQFEAESKQKEAQGLAQIAINKQKEEANLNRAEEARLTNAPFREKFPNLSTAMSNTGLAIAALLPYGTRMYQAGKGVSTPFVKAWESVATEAEAALKTKNMDHARILVDQLVGFKKEAIALEKKSVKSNVIINALSAAAPMETQMLPELMDLSFGSKDSKSKAIDTVFDPVRVPASILQGITAAGLGAKAPIPNVGNPSVARASTEGLKKSFDAINKKKIK